MTVSQIPVPDEARSASALDRVDYADAFLLETEAAEAAEDLARAILEGAPAAMRAALVSGWSGLGLKLSFSDGAILGWPLRESTRDRAVLAAGSRIGMPAELLFARRPGALLFCTFVHHGNAAARAVWAATEPLHVPIVRRLLTDAGGRL